MTKIESVHCYNCNGTGYVRHMNLAGITYTKPCTRCKCRGKLYAEVGTRAWEEGKKIGAIGVGEYPDMHKEKK